MKLNYLSGQKPPLHSVRALNHFLKSSTFVWNPFCILNSENSMNGYYYFIINFTMTFYLYNHLYKKVGVIIILWFS